MVPKRRHVMKLFKQRPCLNCKTDQVSDKDHERGQDCLFCHGTGIEYEEVSPADLDLAALGVLGELRQYLNEKEARQPGHLVRTGEAIRLTPSTILEHLKTLESAADLDELRKIQEKARAMQIMEDRANSQYLKDKVRSALAQAHKEARDDQ